MATPGSPKRQRQIEPTASLMSLGDDMLPEILSRLPSLPSLASAAIACRRLHNIASSVVDHFIAPAPLLGYFVSIVGGDVPSFHRALLLADRNVAGIVRRGDFQLTGFEDYEWSMMDCRHVLLLLTSDRCIAVFNPVSGSRLRIPHCTNISKGGGKSFHCLLPAGGGDVNSIRVLCLERTCGGRVRPHVYSSCTGEWCSHPLAPKGIKAPRRADPHSNHSLPMHAGGRIYWRTGVETLTSLDVGSMEFSHVRVPGEVHCSWSYAIGDTKDGTTSIVSVSTTSHSKIDVRVWFLKEEDGSLSWERQFRVDASEIDPFAGAVNHSRMVRVYGVTAGVVLLCTGYKNNCLRYLAFRLKDTLGEGTTAKRQPLILADFCTSSGWVHPCFMTWPRPSLKAAGGSTENASTSESEQEAAAGSNKKKQV